MSENSTKEKGLINMVPDFVNNVGENLAQPVTKNAGQTFGDIWFLVFGGVSQLAEKRKLKYAIELEKFKKELEEQINAIPEDKRIEPNMQTVAPALENSKYCVEAEEIRKAFANLISRSMNKDYSHYVHPSFADMLKQMSPLDAQNLLLFKKNKSYPICDITYTQNGSAGYKTLFSNLFIANEEQEDYTLQNQSISSLVRFGLVNIPALESLADEARYSDFETNEVFLYTKAGIPEQMGKVALKKKKVDITPLGEAFIRICL